ncbi:MAG: copper ion binding protein [Nitrospinae bacterium]|nr:copper ion binding protein [Nitrospinota bacterium]
MANKKEGNGMQDLRIKVMGMSCNHCVQTIEKAVGEISGVQQVNVDLDKKEVTVAIDENQTKLETITSKIMEVGFEVVEEKRSPE